MDENERILNSRDLDLGSGHTAYHRASLIDIYLHTKCHWNQKKHIGDELTPGTGLTLI